MPNIVYVLSNRIVLTQSDEMITKYISYTDAAMNILPLFIVLIVNGNWNIHNREHLKILVAVNPHMVNTISLFPLISHLPKQFMFILCGFNCLFVEHLHLFFSILIPFSFYLCPITCRKKFANLLQDLIYLTKIERIHKEYASLGRSVY